MTHGASTVGFIGLGIMGRPIARNLRRAGVPLTVWNRSQPAVAALVADGAHAAASVEEVFARSRIVFVMLAHADALDAVLGSARVSHGAGRTDLFAGKVLVNMGTVAPEFSQQLAADVEAAGGRYVEAPVSGSRLPAEQATLVGMVAGDPDVVEEVRPLLEHVCAGVTVCGAVPAALTMKLAVNVFLIATVTGLAESFHFAQRQGLDLACRLVRGAAQRVFRLRPVPAPGRDERRYLSRPARHRGAQVLKGRPRRVSAAGREQEQHERCH